MVRIIIFFSLFIFLNNCGFKKINDPSSRTFSIGDIEIIGEKKLGLEIQNRVVVSSNKDSENTLFLKLNLSKIKTVKEKDITNKVTKYNIELSSNIEIKSNNEIIEKTFIERGDYSVSSNFTDTMRSEKNLENTLANRIAEDLVNFLKIRYRNDT